jgi:Tfp pilus assembly protein PilF
VPDARRRVLLLGWEAADPKLVQSLVDAGQMPHLGRLVTEGVVGNLAAVPPMAGVPLWATLATGVLADRHGVCAPIERGPYGGGTRAVTANAWRAAPVWKIVADHGGRAAVVGWPGTRPAAATGATLAVSDRFPIAAGEDFDGWPMPPDAVHPEALRAPLRELRVHPADIDASQLRFFAPDADPGGAHPRLRALSVLLAACSSTHAAGTWLAEHETWDLLTVRYDILEHVCRGFMAYRAPHMAGTSAEDAALFGDVVDRCYRFLDLLLGRYMRLVGPETTIVVMSDHGFLSGDDRPRTERGPLTETPQPWHRPYGVLVASGPELRRDELVFGASALDVAPTVLTMLGLPVGRDMEGRVLAQIFRGPPVVTWVEVHQSPPPEVAATPEIEAATARALERLRELGIPGPPAVPAKSTVDEVRVLELTTLAQVGFARREWEKTTTLLTELLGLKPDYPFATYLLGRCRLRLGDIEGCREIAGDLLAFDVDSPLAHLVFGLIEAYEERWENALGHYHRALEGAPNHAELHHRTGIALLGLQRWSEAEAAFERAIENDGHRAASYEGLGRALHRQHRYADAAAQYSRSLGLRYENPPVHLRLARALSASGDRAAAVAALQRALALDPSLGTTREAMEVMSATLSHG